jgi:lactoylglutathione lyase
MSNVEDFMLRKIGGLDGRTSGAPNEKIPGARFAYAMLRVDDLDRSISFYVGVLGMSLFRREEFSEGRFTLAFVGYGDGATTIELTHNWDPIAYEHGTRFGHIAVGVPDVYDACAALVRAGAELVRPAGPMKGGTEVIAFLRDPDGYRIELVENGHQ